MSGGFPLLTRRQTALGLTVSAGMPGLIAAKSPVGPISALEVIARIRNRCAAAGIRWSPTTVDTIKAGDPDTLVTGIACTFMATTRLLRAARDAGANLIISHEPTFWSHPDSVAEWVDDPVYRDKAAFIAASELVVFRFHDHWHQIRPEPMSAAFRARLGWERWLIDPTATGFEARYRRPRLPLSELVEELMRKLPARVIRVIGRGDLPVSRVGMGGHGTDSVVAGLREVDALIVPEVREFDSGAYAADLVVAGEAKALIMISHQSGEENGMTLCAKWLQPLVPGVPVRFIASGEPFWSPAGG